MINALLNQTVTLYAKSGYTRDGRESVGVGSSVKARFVEVNKTRFLPNQQVVRIDAKAFFKADQTININDKVTYNGTDYKVHGKKVGRGMNGEAHHVEVELIKWQI